MDVLFLSHCVPNPPDKGERIRAYHEFRHLAESYSVHLACFARSRWELDAVRELRSRCASLYAERLVPGLALARAAVRFAAGDCLTTSYYGSRRMTRYVTRLAREFPLAATVCFSAAMAPYAPLGVPLLLDLVDVDSEKWRQYAERRRPRFLYRTESQRLREAEARFAGQAACSFLSTPQEENLFRRVAPQALTRCLENGVDLQYFNPLASPRVEGLDRRCFIVFVGAMDYYPNVDAVRRFCAEVYPQIRRAIPGLEFLIVGRTPTAAVSRLAAEPGVTVTGSVADVRPYLFTAQAVVAPLRIARGIQNKVLEALAMGRLVLASPEVCRALAPEPPQGVVECHTPDDYIRVLSQGCLRLESALQSRSVLQRRFSWSANLQALSQTLASVAGRTTRPAVLEVA